LTRRANQRHIHIIARILKPAPGNRRRAFLIELLESDGGRTSLRHILPCQRTDAKGVPRELPSEPLYEMHFQDGLPDQARQ
jgi:hypothetical protein